MFWLQTFCLESGWPNIWWKSKIGEVWFDFELLWLLHWQVAVICFCVFALQIRRHFLYKSGKFVRIALAIVEFRIRCGRCIGESLLTSLFTFFLISIRLNSQKPWPYIRTKCKSCKSWLSGAICAIFSSLRAILREISAIKNCEIAVWQKS